MLLRAARSLPHLPGEKIPPAFGGPKDAFFADPGALHQPELLLLDEPLAGLDDTNRRFLLEMLREFVAGGDKAALISSHVSAGLDEVAERVLFIGAGKTLLAAEKEELLACWKWVHFRDNALDEALTAKLTAIRRHPFGSAGLCSDFPALREKLSGAMAAGDVRIENARLADVLIQLTQGG